ncbi:MAG: hypothetical protein AAF614_23460 [Chloroflexota bacterium]
MPYPILFVTQVPIPADFATIGSTFSNHRADMSAVGRGGDLWIRETDGELRNLTQLAGYGESGLQGANAIAVRDPEVHWDGTKAVFSMVIGAPARYQQNAYRWQLYEISGLGDNDTPVITKVPNQPVSYNNVSPIYGSDDSIIFTSDRPRRGDAHHYPMLDEYETTPVNSGLWKLNPITGDLQLLDHAPSGDFSPLIDSFGRIIFTRWDHLQRDQQADDDDNRAANGQDCVNCMVDWSDESASSVVVPNRTENFPEPRIAAPGSNVLGHRFNHFFPWMINQDGTGMETLNHIGRHELHNFFSRSFAMVDGVEDFTDVTSGRTNQNAIHDMFHIAEDPNNPGLFYAIDAPEFGTHSGGMIFSINGAPTDNPDDMTVTYVTHPDTANSANTPSADHTGLYREPLPLSDGRLVAVHTAETRDDANEGTRANPLSRYDFRLKLVVQSGAYSSATVNLTDGISKAISYYDPDIEVTYSGNLWELNPVEVRPRTRPTAQTTAVPSPEQQVFTDEQVNLATFQTYLAQNDLALMVSRNVTVRDDLDNQQPVKLRVPGGVSTTPGSGPIFDIEYFQFYQADLLRSMTRGQPNPRPGRRVLPRPMHDLAVDNFSATGPAGSVDIALDGSVAAFLPAQRALTWQSTDDVFEPVVRERYWLTFQPGEVVVCASCHGLNKTDHMNNTEPTNEPEALRILLQTWKSTSCGAIELGAERPFPTNDIHLSWPHHTSSLDYQLWRSSTPGVTAGNNGETEIANLPVPNNSMGEHTDSGAISASNNYFYRAYSTSPCDADTIASNEVGVFNFDIVAGSN